MTFEAGVQKFCRVGREQKTPTLPLPLLRLREIQKLSSISMVNFMFVSIFSQSVLERSNSGLTQKENDPNFNSKYLVTQTELSIGFVPIERSFLRPLIELFFLFISSFFWDSLIAYVKKIIFF